MFIEFTKIGGGKVLINMNSVEKVEETDQCSYIHLKSDPNPIKVKEDVDMIVKALNMLDIIRIERD